MIYYSASGAPAQEGYCQVDFDTLLKESDILSSMRAEPVYRRDHGPESIPENEIFRYFSHLGRGPIVREKDLAQALNDGEIQAAGLDVLCSEPMAADSPFFSVKDKSHLLITPHVAWAAVEARQRLMKIIAGQIRDFFSCNF